jgi:hypothetical protein
VRDFCAAAYTLIGFTRIESPNDYADVGDIPEIARAHISRRDPSWVPAAEVRGEVEAPLLPGHGAFEPDQARRPPAARTSPPRSPAQGLREPSPLVMRAVWAH